MPTAYISDFENKKRFLLAHEDFFLNGVSVFFNLNYEQLVKYKTILKWYYIASNETIKWDTNIIDDFKQELFIENDIFPEINCNRALPWSIQFIERYENLWSWELLAQNEYVMGNADIRNHFSNQLHPYMADHLESSTHILNGLNHKGQTYGEEVEVSTISTLQKHKELQFQHPIEIDVAESIDWLLLSQNEIMPWNAELIAEYHDKWDWSALSRNPSIPWDINLIKKFEDKIDWTIDTVEIIDGEEKITFFAKSISANLNIKWDEELLSSFIKKLNTWDISISQQAKWGINLLTQFEDFWEYGELSKNKSLWDKVFSELNNPEHLNPLLDIILNKRKQSK